jgi:hypothetical protein
MPAMPIDPTMLATSRRQHANSADKLFARIANCAAAGRQQLGNGQPAGPAARQIGSDVLELIGELAKLAEADRFAAWTRQPAALAGRCPSAMMQS